MTTHPLNVRSEKGIALIVVLLLLGVMAALTTGLTLNGQTEVAMAANETYYAGARAAAEAGMNRAVNQLVDPANNLTNLLVIGTAVPVIGNGPFNLNSQYSYRFEIRDDDDPVLYPAMTPAQFTAAVASMTENNNVNLDTNKRVMLRAIGTGPNGSTVTLSRVLDVTDFPSSPSTVPSNPAILVNGDLDFDGNSFEVKGLKGNVHANGNITGNNTRISGDVTATGTVDPRIDSGGITAGNQPGITVPDIKASDYRNLADYILKANGKIAIASTGVELSTAAANATNWSFSGGQWKAAGASPTTGTYYSETAVYIKGTGSNPPVTMSVIAEGSITIEGNGRFSPANTAGIQFVTNGDFDLGGSAEVEDVTVDFDGQIMAREQLRMTGSTKFQGRVMAQNQPSATNTLRNGPSTLDANSLAGSMTVTYNGHLGDIYTTIPGAPTTYANNIRGWIEQ